MSLPNLDYYDQYNICEESDGDSPLNRKTCCKCSTEEDTIDYEERLDKGFHWFKCEECGHLEEGDE